MKRTMRISDKALDAFIDKLKSIRVGLEDKDEGYIGVEMCFIVNSDGEYFDYYPDDWNVGLELEEAKGEVKNED